MLAVPPLAILNYLPYLPLAYYRNLSKVLKEKYIQFFAYKKAILTTSLFLIAKYGINLNGGERMYKSL